MNLKVARRYNRLLSHQVTELHAGVDWISCTLGSEAPMRWEWANTCTNCLLEIANEGNKIGDSGINGYRGVQVGGSFVGNREDSTYCQISGRHADTFLDRIMRRDLHISRIDLAVTVKFRTMPRHLGEVAYCTADEAYRSLSSSRRRKL